ncbi:GNAT family N-acetyltransferase [Virgibacillus soli]|uniref:GNAT family N-acetyltransferase n=1 Tax=Paracerasibacillus soli TaxID=480284 RepID=A0ABU5CPQ9_9BACI|nr:GNAT family N-acetyltransferase [Virgibacillus soli]MDY0408352.1 GNAT family N-acetyltransferase [Virgibacillus soli]
MLIRYKRNFEKIAMGLLSFMPQEKDIKILQKTITEYEQNPDYHLYLWKEVDAMIGVIGLQKMGEQNKMMIKHLAVDPSHRYQGIGKKMVQEIKKLYKDEHTICASDDIENFFLKCSEEEA